MARNSRADSSTTKVSYSEILPLVSLRSRPDRLFSFASLKPKADRKAEALFLLRKLRRDYLGKTNTVGLLQIGCAKETYG
jgi:hypothetical protein